MDDQDLDRSDRKKHRFVKTNIKNEQFEIVRTILNEQIFQKILKKRSFFLREDSFKQFFYTDSLFSE